MRRKVRTPPIAQILFLTQILIIFILDAFSLLKLSVVQQNSPKCKNESDDTCQKTSVYMSILSSTLTFLILPPSLLGSVSKSNKNLTLSTGISRRGNQKQSATDHEDTQVCSQTVKYLENCRDNANVQPRLSLPETYGEDCLECAECQEVTLTAGILKVLHDNEAVDNQEDIKDVWIFFNRNIGREFFIFLLTINFCNRFRCILYAEDADCFFVELRRTYCLHHDPFQLHRLFTA